MTGVSTNIPCAFCSFDPTAEVVWSTEIVLPFDWKSGNYIGSNARGRAGMRYRRYKANFLRTLKRWLLEHDIKRAHIYRRVYMYRLLGKGQRRFDDDNLRAGCKPLRDCLTETDLITNDTLAQSKFFYDQLRNPTNKPAVKIVIEELINNEH